MSWSKITEVLTFDDNMFEDMRGSEAEDAEEEAKTEAVAEAGGNSSGTESVLYNSEGVARAAALLRMRALRGELNKTNKCVEPFLDEDGEDMNPMDSGSLACELHGGGWVALRAEILGRGPLRRWYLQHLQDRHRSAGCAPPPGVDSAWLLPGRGLLRR